MILVGGVNKMKELKFEELSVKQKLGMVMCGLIP